MALSDRLNRLEGEYGPELCEERPCAQTAHTELVLHADGTEVRIGNPPPPLCEACPERSNPQPRIRHLEVVLDRRGRFLGADSAARIASKGFHPRS